VLDEVAGDNPMGMTQDVGSRLPVHATATGKVLLAFSPEEQVAKLLMAPLQPLTEQTVVDPEQLRRDLARIRQEGIAITVGELEPGFVAVAAPVMDRERQAVAAVSVGGPSLRLTAERLPQLAAMVQMGCPTDLSSAWLLARINI
jgi:IclR family acetate operon transcriptional repressor